MSSNSLTSSPPPSTHSNSTLGSPASPSPSPQQLAAQREEDAAMIEKEAKLSEEQKAKREEVRAQVIREIQSTELSYVQSLDALVQSFVQPLKDRTNTNKNFQDITPSQVDQLCSNLETLANFHHTFIESLNKVSPTPTQQETEAGISIPAVFIKFSNFFKLYIPYLNNYEHCLSTFNSLRSHKRFQEWLQGEVKANLNAHAVKNGASLLDLLSYMIMPIQRVPRYVLLLRELKRQTSPYHAEFASLNDALWNVQHVASVINEGQRAIENANKLMMLQNKLTGEFESLIQPHRRLIREGTVTATYAHGMFSTIRTRKSNFFLFSDALLWTSEGYKFKGLIDLTPAKLAPKSSTSFVIDTANRMIQASCETEEETKSWFEAIDEVVCTLQNERDKLRQRSRVQRARNLGGTANKDAVHQLVTQSLQGLAINAAGSSGGSDDMDLPVKSLSANPGTIGKGSTLGQRSGRKWEESLESSEAKLKREQESLAAFSRERLQADTFAPPSENESGDHTASSVSFAATSSNSNSSASSNATAAAAPSSSNPTPPVIGGDKKYQVRFVSRRGRGTLPKTGCLCTTILVHKDCPLHGEQVQQEIEQHQQ